MQKNLYRLAVIFAVVLWAADICAGCKPQVVKRTNVRGSTKFSGSCGVSSARNRVSNSDISGNMSRLADDLEDLDKKLSRIKPESRTFLNHRQEREVLALKLIHMIQNELLDYKKQDGKRRKMTLLLFNESKILSATAKKIKGFPMADQMQEFKKYLLDVRSGKAKFKGRIPRSDSALLNDIQKEQRKMLEEFHKLEQKNFRKK